MSCAKVSKAHNYLIGYILAVIDNRHRFTYEIAERAKLAARLNNQSVNARYDERKHSVKIDINEIAMIDFHAVSDSQQAKAIDCFLYNSDCAKGFDKSDIVKKLMVYRDLLEFNESDYDSCDWFIESLPLREPKSHDEFVADCESIHCISYRK